jgi:hypothetical protein
MIKFTELAKKVVREKGEDAPFRFTEAGFSAGEALAKLPFDWNGHMECGKFWENDRWRDSLEKREKNFRSDLRIMASDKALETLAPILAEGGEHDEFLILRDYLPSNMECPFCSISGRVVVESNGTVLRLTPACTNPTANLVTEWELDVPSGKLAIANDLRAFFPTASDQNINRASGMVAATLASAKVGMAYGFVGNSCRVMNQTPSSQTPRMRSSRRTGLPASVPTSGGTRSPTTRRCSVEPRPWASKATS